MFCKFCGKRIDPAKNVCPYCSAPQEPRSGGSGYWDILDDDHTAPLPPTRSVPTAQPVTPPSDGRLRAAIQKMQRTNLLTGIVALVCTLCALVAVTIVIQGSLRELNRGMDDVQQSVKAATARLEESDVENCLEALKPVLLAISARTQLIVESSEVFDASRILKLHAEDDKTIFIYKHDSTGVHWEYRESAADEWQNVPQQWNAREINGTAYKNGFSLSMLIIDLKQQGQLKESSQLRCRTNGDSCEPIIIGDAPSVAESIANSPAPTQNPPASETTPLVSSSEPSVPDGGTTPTTPPVGEWDRSAFSSQGGNTDGGFTQAEGNV